MSVRSDMELTVGALLDGDLAGADAVEYLSKFDMSRLTAHQLAGAVDAVMARAVAFPAYLDAVDCCGTGGDGIATYNISTAAAFVVAARGVPIAKHGNRAVTSKSGSADVLEALGVHTHLTPEHSARIMDSLGICFLYAPIFHPGFARLAPIRKAVGKRTIFNLLGPLCNPAKVERQLIGVFAPEHCALMAETASLLGRRATMVVHGEDGSDELSISGLTHVSHLHHGELTYSSLRPQDAGLASHAVHQLVGGDANMNARALRDVLDGVSGAYADAVLLNAAALLMLADKAQSLHDGVALAKSTIARGAARQLLDALIEESCTDA